MIKFEIQTVSEAVANLVAEGLIVERKESDSRSIYKIKQTEENRRKISNASEKLDVHCKIELDTLLGQGCSLCSEPVTASSEVKVEGSIGVSTK